MVQILQLLVPLIYWQQTFRRGLIRFTYQAGTAKMLSTLSLSSVPAKTVPVRLPV
jgi:hypothetical protein